MSKISRQGGVLVVRPKGALQLDCVTTLRSEVAAQIRGGMPLVALDLAETQLIDGAGLEWIIELNEHCGGRGGAVRLCNVCDLCQDLLRITCVAERVERCETLVDVLRSFSQ